MKKFSIFYQGGETMSVRKILMFIAFMSFFVFLAGNAIAGGSPEGNAPTTGTISGPELWGVVIIDCNANAVLTRVKRIVDCNVETQALYFSVPSVCPGTPITPDLALYYVLGDSGSLFGIEGRPICTKVKNFKREVGAGTGGGDLYSFDAQIKFWVE